MLLPASARPADAGAKIRNAGLMALLHEEHEVDVLVPDAPRRRQLSRRFVDLARSDLPDMAQRLWSEDFALKVVGQLRAKRYGAVQAEGIEMARYLSLVPPERRVYDAHNAEFLLQQRLAAGGSGVARLYSRLQWKRLERFERGVVRGSRLTLAVSEHDANQLLALAGGEANVHVVPNAIDVSEYPFRSPAAMSAANLLFVGKLDFRPNAEALRWFIREVLPYVQATLFTVGAAPPRWLVETGQHDPRVAVTGYVPDERPYFGRCSALALPVRTGGGSRLKALVAMALGLPIISTRMGMEGLEAEPETHYVRADTAAEWVDSIRRVLADADLRRHLACNARALVTEQYEWSALRERMRAAYAWL